MKLTDATDLLLAFSRLQSNFTEEISQEIFGAAIGQHVYREFLKEHDHIPIWKFGPRDLEKLAKYLRKQVFTTEENIRYPESSDSFKLWVEKD